MGRATIAYVFYQLGWKSPEAKRALMQPIASPEARRRAVEEWKHWLAEYRANL